MKSAIFSLLVASASAFAPTSQVWNGALTQDSLVLEEMVHIFSDVSIFVILTEFSLSSVALCSPKGLDLFL